MALIALTGGFRVIKAALDNVFGQTRGAGDTIWPASFAYRLITLNLIDQIRDVDLHRWTPVRSWDMGGYQYTTSSHPRPWNPIRALEVAEMATTPRALPRRPDRDLDTTVVVFYAGSVSGLLLPF